MLMIRLDLLHPTEPESTPGSRPELTAEESALLQKDLKAREHDGADWAKEPHDTATALAAYHLGRLYVRAGRIDDGVALRRLAALFYESGGHELKAIAVWKAIQTHKPTATEAEDHLAALYQRLGFAAQARGTREGQRGRPTRS
jgi:hypothetical protein